MLTKTHSLPGGLQTAEITAIDIDELLESSTAQLGQEAIKVLGYQVYEREHGQRFQQEHDQKILNSALLKAGIKRVFTPESVQRYKHRAEYVLRLIAFKQSDMLPRSFGAQVAHCLFNIAAALFSVGLVTWSVIQHALDRWSWWNVPGAVMVLAMLVMAFVPFPDKQWRWRLESLARYTFTVPERALLLAIALKKIDQRVELYVDFREDDRPGCEPFLVARVGRAETYIAVWDEKGYTPSYVEVEK
jgi:hypothetical protein